MYYRNQIKPSYTNEGTDIPHRGQTMSKDLPFIHQANLSQRNIIQGDNIVKPTRYATIQ